MVAPFFAIAIHSTEKNHIRNSVKNRRCEWTLTGESASLSCTTVAPSAVAVDRDSNGNHNGKNGDTDQSSFPLETSVKR